MTALSAPKIASDVVCDPRWAAVLARDAAHDGAFVYSVATTGVYCRPSCPSRAAKASNVRFHADAQAAEHAGFRACLRCRPDGPSTASLAAARVEAACRRMQEAQTPPPLAALAREAGLSAAHFHRLFKAQTGVTPAAYARHVRAARVRSALQAGSPVTAAAYDAGFNSSGRFYAAADAMLGMTPGARRRGGAGETLRFAVGRSRLGAVLAASSARGICAVLLGDDPDALVRDLQDRFPHAELVGGDAAFEARMAQVVGVVQGELPAAALPLDIRGTAFQQRAWAALQAIPAGATADYAQVADRIGAPGAARAVAGACAANPIAVAIPCHRVVRRAGDISGYRWGWSASARCWSARRSARQAQPTPDPRDERGGRRFGLRNRSRLRELARLVAPLLRLATQTHAVALVTDQRGEPLGLLRTRETAFDGPHGRHRSEGA